MENLLNRLEKMEEDIPPEAMKEFFKLKEKVQSGKIRTNKRFSEFLKNMNLALYYF